MKRLMVLYLLLNCILIKSTFLGPPETLVSARVYRVLIMEYYTIRGIYKIPYVLMQYRFTFSIWSVTAARTQALNNTTGMLFLLVAGSLGHPPSVSPEEPIAESEVRNRDSNCSTTNLTVIATISYSVIFNWHSDHVTTQFYLICSISNVWVHSSTSSSNAVFCARALQKFPSTSFAHRAESEYNRGLKRNGNSRQSGAHFLYSSERYLNPRQKSKRNRLPEFSTVYCIL